jgi:hypothetical protein
MTPVTIEICTETARRDKTPSRFIHAILKVWLSRYEQA